MPRKKTILLTLLLILFVGGLFISQNPTLASVVSQNYKHYKAKYKSKKDKGNFFKIKELKKKNQKLYFQWKAVCDAHKYDTDSQFQKLPPNIQEMCNQYYSYRGYKKYAYWRDKHNDNNSDDNETIAETPFVCGTDTVEDADGNEYDTVEINDQCWMAENMRVGTRINGNSNQTNNDIIEKYCYGDDASDCITYGGLYSWDEAMQYVTTEGTRGICPSGWHIPTDAEFHTLEEYLKDVGQSCDETRGDPPNAAVPDCYGAEIKMLSGGSSGLNVPYAGIMITGGIFLFEDARFYLLTSNQNPDEINYYWRASFTSVQGVCRGSNILKSWGASVRCLKD